MIIAVGLVLRPIVSAHSTFRSDEMLMRWVDMGTRPLSILYGLVLSYT